MINTTTLINRINKKVVSINDTEEQFLNLVLMNLDEELYTIDRDWNTLYEMSKTALSCQKMIDTRIKDSNTISQLKEVFPHEWEHCKEAFEFIK